jgi:hypothetical protein
MAEKEDNRGYKNKRFFSKRAYKNGHYNKLAVFLLYA